MLQKSCLDLTERVAVVFGATSGLGREIAVGLAEHGAHVVPAGRRANLLEEVCEQIRSLNARTLLMPCDVKDRASIGALRDRVLSDFGKVDILVNAAGMTFRKPTVAIEDAEWTGLFDINVTGI